MKFDLTKIDNMKKEISGMGNSYEKYCREMLKYGLEWVEQNPDKKINISRVETDIIEVYGIVNLDNDNAKKLSDHIVSMFRDCTGAQHQAVMEIIKYIEINGFDKYIDKMNS